MTIVFSLALLLSACGTEADSAANVHEAASSAVRAAPEIPTEYVERIDCPEPHVRQAGESVLCAIVPTEEMEMEPAYVAVRVVDASRVDTEVLVGQLLCSSLDDWVIALLQSQGKPCDNHQN